MTPPSKTPLQQSNQLLQKLFDSLNEIVCALDTEGRFVYINQACYRIWGYQPEELIGISCYDIMVPQDQPITSATVQEVVDNQLAHQVLENQYYRKDGKVVTMLWEGGGYDARTGLLYSTGKDISEQRQLEKSEKQHREMLEQFLERITDGFMGLDKDARITYWNQAAEKISGLFQDRMVGQVLWDVLPEPSRSLAKKKLPFIQKQDKPVRFEYFTERLKIWIEVNAYVSGTGISVFFRDVTERHSLQEQLLDEKERLHQEKEQQQKRITSAVIKATEDERAHVGKELHDNVNQVLTTVKLYAELCLSEPARCEELLKKSGQLLQASINEIRGLSKRLSAPSLGSIQIKDSVGELVEAINTSRHFQVDYEHQVDDLRVNEEIHIAVYRILQEHFTNIIKHAQATNVVVRLLQEGNALNLYVHDNGVGFDPLLSRKGIGVENMTSRAEGVGGSLKLESAVGQGCILQVMIPIVSL